MPPFTDAAFGNAPRFTKAAIGGLPLPVYALKLIALGKQDGPENIEDSLLLPAAEGAVPAAVVAELQRKMVPLAPQ